MSTERTDGTARWIVELQALLLSTEGFDDFLQEVAAAAVRALPSAIACGVTLQPNGRARTVAASSDLASQVDELQYSSGEGPCLQAMQTGVTVYVPDLGREDRWPGFTVGAFGYGIRTVLSVPLRGLRASIGALNLYSMELDPFAQDSRAEAAGRGVRRWSGRPGAPHGTPQVAVG
jgi:GAF domain-containing protein